MNMIGIENIIVVEWFNLKITIYLTPYCDPQMIKQDISNHLYMECNWLRDQGAQQGLFSIASLLIQRYENIISVTVANSLGEGTRMYRPLWSSSST